MIIPKQFTVMSQTYNVVLVDKIIHETEGGTQLDCNGLCQIEDNKILLCKSAKQSRLESIFWHEAVHAILAEMNSGLGDNEEFVSIIGSLIHQVISTSKGDLCGSTKGELKKTK